MTKEMEILNITTRIALLEARDKDNANIIRKLKRKLRKLQNEN